MFYSDHLPQELFHFPEKLRSQDIIWEYAPKSDLLNIFESVSDVRNGLKRKLDMEDMSELVPDCKICCYSSIFSYI